MINNLYLLGEEVNYNTITATTNNTADTDENTETVINCGRYLIKLLPVGIDLHVWIVPPCLIIWDIATHGGGLRFTFTRCPLSVLVPTYWELEK